MGDGESSSRGGGGGGGGGTGDGGGETVVMDHGRRKSSCGYCRSNGFTSICHGLWALSITADDYQELLDRGFRRSGSFLYKPDMEKMCCPSYTIRLRARDFIPCKEQVRVQKKMHRFLDGSIDIKKTGQVKDTPDSQKFLFNMAGDASCSTISALLDKPAVTCKKLLDEEEFIRNLSDKIDESIRKFISTGVFPSTMQLPNAVVKKVTERAKKKLMETSEDLLYTSNISFQIAAALRHSQSAVEDIPQLSLLPDAVQERDLAAVTPNIVAEKLAFFMEQHEELSGLITRACNGHLNFYSATKEDSPMLTSDACAKTSNGSGSSSKRSITTDDRAVVPHKKRKLEMQMKRSSFDPEEFALYRKYQIKVHGDKPEKVTEDSYRRFLVDTPIIYVPPCDVDKTVPPSGFGSFHQQYVMDGKLVAVGVVDILPRCLSSKYLFWDPDLSFLSLGKYSALQEINWVNEAHAHCPSLEYYYLGYYIHTCRKMRYKAAYRPSELLCPLRYRWVPFDIARPLLDEKSYVVLSNFVTQNDPEFPTQIPRNAIGKSGSHSVHNGLNQASCDNELIGFDYGVTDTRFNDESGSTSCSTSVAYDPQDTDISNIIIDLNGSRVKVKDLQQVFGPIDKKHFHELEMQLYRYIKAVGKMLSNRMIYSL